MRIAHEDSRRTLSVFPEGKLIMVKLNTVIGKHYHKIKTELFILSSGSCILFTKTLKTGEHKSMPMKVGTIYTMEPNTYHEFHLTAGSVLVGLNSHIYDPTDDYKL